MRRRTELSAGSPMQSETIRPRSSSIRRDADAQDFDTTVINEAKATGNLNLIPTFGEPAPSSIWTSWFGHIINGSDIVNGTMIAICDLRSDDPLTSGYMDATRPRRAG